MKKKYFNKHKTSNESGCEYPKQQIHDLFFQSPNPSVFGNIQKSRDSYVLKKLHIASLISLLKLCDFGCTAIIDKKRIHVVNDNHLVLSVKRNRIDGLKRTPLTTPDLLLSTFQSFQSDNSIIHKTNFKKNLHSIFTVAFLVQL